MSTTKVVVLVTGCSKGGIGFSLCEEFASRGCKVYATARRLEAMEGFSDASISKLALDVTKDDSVQEVVQAILEKEGQIDVLVNNAGIGSTGAVIDVDMQELIRTFDTNVFSINRMAKAVIPHMASRKSGTIVNVGSIAGAIPAPWGGIYGASKAAVHAITDALYMECTPFNINVVLLVPGGVKSNIANNQAERVQLPSNSLYSAYTDSILKKLYTSQGASSMPADVFAKKVVNAALQPRPPRYLTLAAMSTVYQILQWLPRGWVLRYLWKFMGEGPRKAAQKSKKP